MNPVDGQKKLVLDFMHKQHMCVISTQGDSGMVESAAMAFSETDDLELIFSTSNSTRKYLNLQKNPQIAVVLGWSVEDFITIQYQGVAQELARHDLDAYREPHVLKNPWSKPYAYLEDNRYFKVTPKWIRYSDLKSKPPTIFTLEF